MHRWPRGARGRSEAGEFDEDGRRVRGRRRRRWRRCRASGGLWIGGEEEGVEAELLGASARLGVAGGHGYGDDDGELRSVAGGETEERGGGRSRERGRSERGSGTSPWRREEVGEAATAKQEVAGVGARASSTQLLRGEGEEDDWQLGCTVTGRAEAGPATGMWPRYGSFSLSLSFSNHLSFLLFCKFRALLKILKHFQKCSSFLENAGNSNKRCCTIFP